MAQREQGDGPGEGLLRGHAFVRPPASVPSLLTSSGDRGRRARNKRIMQTEGEEQEVSSHLLNSLRITANPPKSQNDTESEDESSNRRLLENSMDDSEVDVLNVTDNEWIENHATFDFGERLGKGGQGAAYLVQWRVPKMALVLKVFKKKKYALQETDILRKVTPHPRIVEFLDLQHGIPTPRHSSITLAYCNGGDLFHLKHRYITREKTFSEQIIWKVFFQLAQAMAYLHWGYGTREGFGIKEAFNPYRPYDSRHYSVVHRDIKTPNILLVKAHDADEMPNIRLADFGLAMEVKKKNFGKQCRGGTPLYQAPEAVNAPFLAGPAQDMWGVGSVIHEMALGGAPVDTFRGDMTKAAGNERDATYPRLVSRIDISPSKRYDQWANDEKKGPTGANAAWRDTYSPLLNYWMLRCLDFNPIYRATALDLINYLGPTFEQVLEFSKGDPNAFAEQMKKMDVPEFNLGGSG